HRHGRRARAVDGTRPPRGRGRRVSLVATMRTDPKRELWFVWYSTVAFYSLYTVVFFLLTRTQPPSQPWLRPDQTGDGFAGRGQLMVFGFALIFVLGCFSGTALAL